MPQFNFGAAEAVMIGISGQQSSRPGTVNHFENQFLEVIVQEPFEVGDPVSVSNEDSLGLGAVCSVSTGPGGYVVLIEIEQALNLTRITELGRYWPPHRHQAL